MSRRDGHRPGLGATCRPPPRGPTRRAGPSRAPCVPAVAPEGAERARGGTRPAQASTQRYQIDMGREVSLLRDQVSKDGVAVSRRGNRRDPSETPGDSVDVGVDRKGGMPAGEKKNAAGGFLPHPPEACQVIVRLARGHRHERIEAERPMIVLDPPQSLLNHPALRVRQTASANRLLQLAPLDLEHALPRRVSSTQVLIGSVAVPVAGVLGENRQYELVEWREPSTRLRPTERTFQSIEAFTDPASKVASPHGATGAGRCVKVPSTRTMSSAVAARPSAPALVSVNDLVSD